MPADSHTARRVDLPTLLALLAGSVLVGLCLVQAPLIALATLLGLVGVTFVARMPKPLYVLFMLVLIFQDPFRILSGGSETAFYFFVQRIDEAILFPFGIWMLLSSTRTQGVMAFGRLPLVMIGVFGGMLLSSLLAWSQPVPALIDFLLIAKPFLLFAIGASLALSPQDVHRGLRPVLFIGIAIVLSALVFLLAPELQEAYFQYSRPVDERLGYVSAQGFFDGPGQYSWFCAVVFAASYAAYLAFTKSIYIVMSVISATFTVLAWRRKSIGAVVAMLLVAAMVRATSSKGHRMRAVAAVALVTLLAGTILAPFVTDLFEYTVVEYSDPQSTARYALYHASGQIAFDRFPLGTGFGSFGSYPSRVYYSDVYNQYGLSTIRGLSPQFGEYITDAFWPMVLGQGGVISLLSYLGFFVLVISRLWRASKLPNLLPEDRFLLYLGLFVLVGSLLESTASPIFDATLASSLVMIPAGVCWSRIAEMEGA